MDDGLDAMTRVLYIEDEPNNRMLVRRLFMGLASDLEYAEVDNARMGIQMATDKPFDIILMDISMPDMDGLTATGIIRKTDSIKDTPIIALTANAMEGDRERFLAAGCDGYISKPIDIDTFIDNVRDYISKIPDILKKRATAAAQPTTGQSDTAQTKHVTQSTRPKDWDAMVKAAADAKAAANVAASTVVPAAAPVSEVKPTVTVEPAITPAPDVKPEVKTGESSPAATLVTEAKPVSPTPAPAVNTEPATPVATATPAVEPAKPVVEPVKVSSEPEKTAAAVPTAPPAPAIVPATKPVTETPVAQPVVSTVSPKPQESEIKPAAKPETPEVRTAQQTERTNGGGQ